MINTNKNIEGVVQRLMINYHQKLSKIEPCHGAIKIKNKDAHTKDCI